MEVGWLTYMTTSLDPLCEYVCVLGGVVLGGGGGWVGVWHWLVTTTSHWEKKSLKANRGKRTHFCMRTTPNPLH